MSYHTFELELPRHACGPRETARAGGVWRILQDAALIGSRRCGYTMKRYSDERCGFVVRSETVLHHAELHFDHRLGVATWVSSFVRRMISDRQVRIRDRSTGELLVSATQQWVHISTDQLKPLMASDSVISAFPVLDREPDARLPPFEECEGPIYETQIDIWHTWMDPLGHVNHPAYLDWCDEHIARILHSAGIVPADLVAVAEKVQFVSGVVAPQVVSVTTQAVGRTDQGDVVLTHRIRDQEGTLCARGTTIRRYPADSDRLFELFTNEASNG